MHGWRESPAAVLSVTLPSDLSEQVARALEEDIGSGDVTAALISPRTQAHARVLCRESAVLCGIPWFNEAFRRVDPGVAIDWRCREGEAVTANAILCTLHGPARALLTAERTALNFLQLLSATATVTQRYVEAVRGTSCRILDTRKTLPGLRSAQKYAVRCGGGSNHRLGLYDLVLIKENHIAAAGGIAAAIAAARSQAPQLRVELEAEDLEQVHQGLAASADIIMLDNFTIEQMRAAVAANRAHARPAQLEASGGVSLQNLRAIAETGVDYISVGALTKNVAAIDLSLRIEDSAG